MFVSLARLCVVYVVKEIIYLSNNACFCLLLYPTRNISRYLCDNIYLSNNVYHRNHTFSIRHSNHAL